MSHEPQRLLVYGLLRRGHSMENLMQGAEPLGRRQVSGYVLYDLGEYPGAVPGPGMLVAELYAMPDDADWSALDRAEGVDENPPLYRRELVNHDGQSAYLYVYARPVDAVPRIESGDWLER